MEHIGRVIWLFPAFGQIGLDDEGARPHVPADFVAQEPAAQEAQGAMRPGVAGQMGIEVHGIPSAHAEDSSTFGRLDCFAPECGHTIGEPGRKGRSSRQAGFQQITATQLMGMSRLNVLWFHDRPSFSRHAGRFTASPDTSWEPLLAASGAPLPTAPVSGRGQALSHPSSSVFMRPRGLSCMQPGRREPQLIPLIAWHRGAPPAGSRTRSRLTYRSSHVTAMRLP